MSWIDELQSIHLSVGVGGYGSHLGKKSCDRKVYVLLRIPFFKLRIEG